MADENGLTDEEIDAEVLDPRLREELKRARKERKELRQLREEKARNSLNDLFNEAKIPHEGIGKLFRDTYAGSPTLEAIVAKAQEYGALAPPPAPTLDEAAELERLRKIQNATSDTGGILPDPVAELQAAIAKATTNEEVMKLMAEYEAAHSN